jgi:hypothetical protein
MPRGLAVNIYDPMRALIRRLEGLSKTVRGYPGEISLVGRFSASWNYLILA